MTPYQEPKYMIEPVLNASGSVEGHRIVNRQSGEAIPDDEPLFILRARDSLALSALWVYLNSLPGGTSLQRDHRKAVMTRIHQFLNWQANHKDRIRQPDTVMDSGWTTNGFPI